MRQDHQTFAKPIHSSSQLLTSVLGIAKEGMEDPMLALLRYTSGSKSSSMLLPPSGLFLLSLDRMEFMLIRFKVNAG
jgi:hypothetical protein